MDLTTLLLLIACVASIGLAAYAWRPISSPAQVEYFDVTPKDAFVLKYEGVLSSEQRASVASYLDAFRAGDHKTLILEKGFTLQVVRLK